MEPKNVLFEKIIKNQKLLELRYLNLIFGTPVLINIIITMFSLLWTMAILFEFTPTISATIYLKHLCLVEGTSFKASLHVALY